MNKDKNKSDDILLAILHVLRKEASSKDYALTNSEIIKRITKHEDFRDIIVDRKSLRNTVRDKLANILNFYDRNPNEKLIKVGTKYYFENTLSPIDIQMLIDDVMFSKMRTKEDVERLTRLLKQQTTKEIQAKINYTDYIPEKQYTLNQEIKNNIKIIRGALQENKDIYNRETIDKKWLELSFNSYNSEKKLHPKKEDGKIKKYTIYPIDIVEAYNNYFLICVKEGSDFYSHYRIDLMTGMKIVSSMKCPVNLIRDWRNVKRRNISGYLTEHLYMSYKTKEDNIIRKINLRIKKGPKEEITNLTFLQDHFGSNWELVIDESNYVDVEVECLTYGITVFVRQYIDIVKVIGPKDVKEKVEESLIKSFNCYFEHETLLEQKIKE
jgi:hypothetical protein